MYEHVTAMATKCAAASNTTYLDQVLAAYSRAQSELPIGENMDAISLAVWSEFEAERKRRTAALAAS